MSLWLLLIVAYNCHHWNHVHVSFYQQKKHIQLSIKLILYQQKSMMANDNNEVS